MNVSDFNFDLPEELIAQDPLEDRASSRLLVLDKETGDVEHKHFRDVLKYLKKGGRITPTAAAIGTLLNIKPILQLHGGKLDSFAKVMSMKQAKSKLIGAVRKEIEDRFPEELSQGKISISVAHTFEDLNSQELADFVKEVKQSFADAKFFVCDPLPLFIACHTGPKALAVGFAVDRLGIGD